MPGGLLVPPPPPPAGAVDFALLFVCHYRSPKRHKDIRTDMGSSVQLLHGVLGRAVPTLGTVADGISGIDAQARPTPAHFDHRLPPAACRLPPAACRLPPAACRLPPAPKLPCPCLCPQGQPVEVDPTQPNSKGVTVLLGRVPGHVVTVFAEDKVRAGTPPALRTAGWPCLAAPPPPPHTHTC
jgi:hypothetical protein